MEFYYDGYLYSQRTEKSKILKVKDDKIVERYESPKDLPQEISHEYCLYKIMTEKPDAFFYYQKKSNKITITGTIASNNLRNIVIPETIENLEVLLDGTMTKYPKLENIEFYNTSKRLPIELINKNLKRIVFGPEMQLSNGDFINCNNLEEIIIPENTSIIPNNFCHGCVNLRKINLENITKIGSSAFYNCKKLNAKISDKIEELSIKSFYGSGIENIYLPNTLKKIESYVFSKCQNIKTVINESTIKLDETTFKNSNFISLDYEK